MTQTQAPPMGAELEPREADVAGRAVFAWVLVPAAGRLVHELAEGNDAHAAVEELRTAVRLLDHVGWPDDESGAARLDSGEAAIVRMAARSQLRRGLNPDRGARNRVARGPVTPAPARRGSVAGLLETLERGPR